MTIANLSLLIFAQSGVAQLPTNPIRAGQIVFNDPTPPSQGSPDGRQQGGASRGDCRSFEQLTALVPSTQGKVWGKTISDRPSFWFYLPSELTEKTPIEFTLQDENDQYIYNTRFSAAKTKSGLIRLTVPATAKPLEVGKSYTWTFSVYCDPTKPSSSVFVQGSIQRVTLDQSLKNRLANQVAFQQVQLYAENGIWFEAFDGLAELYRKDRAINSAWGSLLEQVKLDQLKSAPFTDCCKLQSSR
ncbi:membrane protein related to metalloendopeptidase [Leptolyngbya sp. NIES-2104]|nr:membrane protein related to metalloendopeptidase [Leptolyngbya sp. NIES-2104]